MSIEYFDYFEIDLTRNITSLNIVTGDLECTGTRIYHLKPITTSALSVRNALVVPSVVVNDVVNVKKD